MTLAATLSAPPAGLVVDRIAGPARLDFGLAARVRETIEAFFVRRTLRDLVRRHEAGDKAGLARAMEFHRLRYAKLEHGAFNLLHSELTAADVAAGPARTAWLGPETPSDAVLFYVPGGSFVGRRSPRVSDFITGLARASGVRAQAVDYRLAPEFPYPSAPEDVVAAFDKLTAAGQDPGRVVMAAESAGAAVALSALFRLRAAGRLPAALVLFSPWSDLALSGWSLVARGLSSHSPYALEMMTLARHFYLQGTSPADPMASPAWGDLTGLPPVLIHTSRTDLLHDDARALAERMAAAGTPVTLRIWPRGAHVFERYEGPETDRSLAEASRFLRERLGASQAGAP